MKSFIVFALFVALCAGGCTKRRPPSDRQPPPSASQPPSVPETVAEMQRKRIQDTVKDAGRRQRALAVKDRAAQELAQFRKYEQGMMRDLAALGRSYDASKAELRAHFEALNERRRGMLRRVAKLRMELRKVLTAEEWAKVTGPWRKAAKAKQAGTAVPTHQGGAR